MTKSMLYQLLSELFSFLERKGLPDHIKNGHFPVGCPKSGAMEMAKSPQEAIEFLRQYLPSEPARRGIAHLGICCPGNRQQVADTLVQVLPENILIEFAIRAQLRKRIVEEKKPAASCFTISEQEAVNLIQDTIDNNRAVVERWLECPQSDLTLEGEATRAIGVMYVYDPRNYPPKIHRKPDPAFRITVVLGIFPRKWGGFRVGLKSAYTS